MKMAKKLRMTKNIVIDFAWSKFILLKKHVRLEIFCFVLCAVTGAIFSNYLCSFVL